jgi:hypothetical protein
MPIQRCLKLRNCVLILIVLIIPIIYSNFNNDFEFITIGDPLTSEGIYGTDYDGIFTFDNYTIGSDPWDGTTYGTAQIQHSCYGHSYVYEIYNGGRGIDVLNDMSSNWKIECYVNLQQLYQGGYGHQVIFLRGLNDQHIHWGYSNYYGGWLRNIDGSEQILQYQENWTSNSWMYWRLEFTASSDTYRYYVNNTLLDTIVYSGINILDLIDFDTGSWGNAGTMRIDSLSYSWHPDYYNGMLFELADSDADGMPNVWELDNELDPDDGSDALEDLDSDGLLNLYEYTNSTDPNDADSDNDGLNDGPEINTYLTDPNDADSDNDGLNDGSEVNIYLTDPNDADSDNDGLNDGSEVNIYLTDPNDPDSDNDTFSDKVEIDAGKDPNDPNSYPGMFEPERFSTFLIFMVLAVAVSITGVVIIKKQHKQRYFN